MADSVRLKKLQSDSASFSHDISLLQQRLRRHKSQSTLPFCMPEAPPGSPKEEHFPRTASPPTPPSPRSPSFPQVSGTSSYSNTYRSTYRSSPRPDNRKFDRHQPARHVMRFHHDTASPKSTAHERTQKIRRFSPPKLDMSRVLGRSTDDADDFPGTHEPTTVEQPMGDENVRQSANRDFERMMGRLRKNEAARAQMGARTPPSLELNDDWCPKTHMSSYTEGKHAYVRHPPDVEPQQHRASSSDRQSSNALPTQSLHDPMPGPSPASPPERPSCSAAPPLFHPQQPPARACRKDIGPLGSDSGLDLSVPSVSGSRARSGRSTPSEYTNPERNGVRPHCIPNAGAMSRYESKPLGRPRAAAFEQRETPPGQPFVLGDTGYGDFTASSTAPYNGLRPQQKHQKTDAAPPRDFDADRQECLNDTPRASRENDEARCDDDHRDRYGEYRGAPVGERGASHREGSTATSSHTQSDRSSFHHTHDRDAPRARHSDDAPARHNGKVGENLERREYDHVGSTSTAPERDPDATADFGSDRARGLDPSSTYARRDGEARRDESRDPKWRDTPSSQEDERRSRENDAHSYGRAVGSWTSYDRPYTSATTAPYETGKRNGAYPSDPLRSTPERSFVPPRESSNKNRRGSYDGDYISSENQREHDREPLTGTLRGGRNRKHLADDLRGGYNMRSSDDRTPPADNRGMYDRKPPEENIRGTSDRVAGYNRKPSPRNRRHSYDTKPSPDRIPPTENIRGSYDRRVPGDDHKPSPDNRLDSYDPKPSPDNRRDCDDHRPSADNRHDSYDPKPSPINRRGSYDPKPSPNNRRDIYDRTPVTNSHDGYDRSSSAENLCSSYDRDRKPMQRSNTQAPRSPAGRSSSKSRLPPSGSDTTQWEQSRPGFGSRFAPPSLQKAFATAHMGTGNDDGRIRTTDTDAGPFGFRGGEYWRKMDGAQGATSSNEHASCSEVLDRRIEDVNARFEQYTDVLRRLKDANPNNDAHQVALVNIIERRARICKEFSRPASGRSGRSNSERPMASPIPKHTDWMPRAVDHQGPSDNGLQRDDMDLRNLSEREKDKIIRELRTRLAVEQEDRRRAVTLLANTQEALEHLFTENMEMAEEFMGVLRSASDFLNDVEDQNQGLKTELKDRTEKANAALVEMAEKNCELTGKLEARRERKSIGLVRSSSGPSSRLTLNFRADEPKNVKTKTEPNGMRMRFASVSADLKRLQRKALVAVS
eukprot:GEMP01002504.1.p1 GENE.GEMP01002504.1~~GEMP01002504.1.p1  ORF type:complete len:1225 (+),score=263.05 GEMP01002504.1:75-3749(+)